jgi:hypothetical protein
MPATIDKNRVLLTVDDITRWRDEADQLKARISKDQARLGELLRKLEYADFLSREGAVDLFPHVAETTVGAAFERAPMTEAVPEILGSRPRPMKPKEIRAALAAKGFKEEQLGNYFYTVLMRLTKRGTIIKLGSRYGLPQKLEAADDTRPSNGSSTASSEHRPTSGGTHSGPVNPRPGGGT